MSQPLPRLIVLGASLWRYDIDLFLQWGFNFFNTFLSRREISPYGNTDCDVMYLSGDAFIVYPNYAGRSANMSIRLVAMQELLSQYEAWQAQIERYCREVSERMETHKREHPVLRPWEMRYDYGELRSFLTDAQASAKTIAQRIGEIRAYMASGKTPNPRQFDFYTQSFRGQVSGLEIAYRTLKGKDFAPRLILGDPTQRPMR